MHSSLMNEMVTTHGTFRVCTSSSHDRHCGKSKDSLLVTLITVENPMLEVTYVGKEEKYIFVGSFLRRLERECERTYELIPGEDVDMHAAFQTFLRNVSAIAKDATQMLELWEDTHDSWLEIEPEELDVTDETLIHIKYLLNISGKVHFLKAIVLDLSKYDFVWIVVFNFRDWSLWWMTDE